MNSRFQAVGAVRTLRIAAAQQPPAPDTVVSGGAYFFGPLCFDSWYAEAGFGLSSAAFGFFFSLVWRTWPFAMVISFRS